MKTLPKSKKKSFKKLNQLVNNSVVSYYALSSHNINFLIYIVLHKKFIFSISRFFMYLLCSVILKTVSLKVVSLSFVVVIL